MVDTSGTYGCIEHGSLDESHIGIVGGGHDLWLTRELDLGNQKLLSFPPLSPPPYPLCSWVVVWPIILTAEAGSKIQPWESKVLLRLFGLYS